MRCPHCGGEIDTKDLEVAIETVNKFVHRNTTYGQLKAAAQTLERLKAKYQKEGNDG